MRGAIAYEKKARIEAKEEEIKFLNFRKLLRQEKDDNFYDYIKNLCLFRQAEFGYIDKNSQYEKNIGDIITKKGIKGRNDFPEKMKKARDYLLEIQENDNESFERIIKELEKVRQK